MQGYECSLWQAIVAPAAASPALITQLNREIGAVLDDPELRAAFVKNGIEAQASSPAELAARINADAKKWRDVITSARDLRELTLCKLQVPSNLEIVGLKCRQRVASTIRMGSAINPLSPPRHG